MKLNLVKNYKTYDHYRDSGVEWLGEIPNYWNAEKIKTKIEKHFSGVWGEEKKGDVNDYLCLRVADFDYPKLSFKNVKTIRNVAPKDQHRILKNEDILMEKSGGGDKQPVGRAILFNSDKKMFCANFIEVLRFKKEVNSKFFVYLLFALYNIGLNKRSIKQNTGIQNLDLNYFFNELISIPPQEAQQKIADYLDEKTEKIDKIIANKKKLIELLEEKKKTIINKSVTRGLDDDVKMKDSGFEWLGEIPRDWNLHKLKTKFNFLNGFAFKSENYQEEGLPIIRIGDMGKRKINAKELKRVPSEMKYQIDKFMVKENDILLALTGATIGKASIYNSKEEAYLNQRVATLRAKKGVKQKFLFYIVSSDLFKVNIFTNCFGGAQENIGKNEIGGMFFPFPGEETQQKIADYLDDKTENIDKTIKKINKSINLLIEYKASLISYVVTGKIKI